MAMAASKFAALDTVRRGAVPSSIVNSAVLDDPRWRAKLQDLAARGGMCTAQRDSLRYRSQKGCMLMNGAQAVAAALKAEGVETLTGFPHNQIIDAAAEIGIRPIIARTERVAANIADGVSRMSDGRLIGVCAVQYGPGIENVFGAVAQAYADASPVLILTGGYDSHEAGVVPNFEVMANYRAVTKWSSSVNHVERIPQVMAHAFAKLRTGKGGPVVIEVPDNLMGAELPADAAPYVRPRLSRPSFDMQDVQEMVSALLGSRSPMIVAGQGVLYARACEELKTFAELLELPVMTTLAGKSAFPEDHELSLGTGGMSRTNMVDQWLAKKRLHSGRRDQLHAFPLHHGGPSGKDDRTNHQRAGRFVEELPHFLRRYRGCQGCARSVNRPGEGG